MEVDLQSLFELHATWCVQLYSLAETSNVNDIETKAEQSFDLGFVFDIEAKRTCLFRNL